MLSFTNLPYAENNIATIEFGDSGDLDRVCIQFKNGHVLLIANSGIAPDSTVLGSNYDITIFDKHFKTSHNQFDAQGHIRGDVLGPLSESRALHYIQKVGMI